jgi:3-oxoacyl-[acyl-carrier protein] reductase
LGVYAASKWALLGYSQALYKELANTGIRVTAVCPGVVNTEMTAHFEEPPNSFKIQPNEIFKAIEYLLSLSKGTAIPELTVECEYFANRPA